MGRVSVHDGTLTAENICVESMLYFTSPATVETTGYQYVGATDDGTGLRKDGVVLFTASRTSSGNPSNTQKLFDFNGAPGTTYNAWDAFTGDTAGEHTYAVNIDAKRINTAVASGAITDIGLNVSVRNKTDSSGGTLTFEAAHIKAQQDSSKKCQDLRGMHIECVDNGTSAGTTDILLLGTDSTTINYGIRFASATVDTAEICLSNGELIDNITDGTVKVTTTNLKVQPSSAGNSVLQLYADSAAYCSITQANAGGITFESVSDGTPGFTFNDEIFLIDDTLLYFGSNNDFSMEYDEDGNNVLSISGANMRVEGNSGAQKIEFRDGDLTIHSSTDGQLDITADTLAKVNCGELDVQPAAAGNSILKLLSDANAYVTITQADGAGVTFESVSDGTSGFTFNDPVTLIDDKKLTLGTGADWSIEYDEDGNDVASITGANMRVEGNSGAQKIEFRDSGLFVHSNADGKLTISADGTSTDDISISGSVTCNDTFTWSAVGGQNKIIAAGSYSSMLTHAGSELVTVAATSSGNGWYLGYGCYIRATGEDGKPFGFCATLESTNTTGIDRMQGAQFIVGLGTAGGTEAAHLKTLGGDATAGMYGTWCKVFANSNCVCDAGSRVAPLWIDNQMSGTISGEEYGIFATTGASKPDALIGLETTSSGWANLLLFDETSYDQDPILSTGTCKVDATKNSTGTIKISLNGTTYYLGYWAVADLTS